MNIKRLLAGAAITLCASLSLQSQAQNNLIVKVNKPAAAIQSTMWGVFF